jgi:hypothetical protein
MSQHSLFNTDIFPRSSVTTKLATYKPPNGAPISEPEQQAYRDLIVDIVYIAWHQLHRAVNLEEIYFGFPRFKNGLQQEWILGVRERVQSRIDNDLWVYAEYPRGKRTVDRRVNEAASPDFYTDNVARIACVSIGVYQPNPELMK